MAVSYRWSRPVSSSTSATGWEGNTWILESQSGEHCSRGQGVWEESDKAHKQTGKLWGPNGDDHSLAFMSTMSVQELSWVTRDNRGKWQALVRGCVAKWPGRWHLVLDSLDSTLSVAMATWVV